ncbi:hypothetical protein JCM18897A_39120 [Streptomyces sp. JCM 18897]
MKNPSGTYPEGFASEGTDPGAADAIPAPASRIAAAPMSEQDFITRFTFPPDLISPLVRQAVRYSKNYVRTTRKVKQSRDH